MGASRFAKLLKLEIAAFIHGACDIKFYGDPSGEYGSDHDEETYFQILRANGIQASPAGHTNDPTVRIEAVERQLTTMVDGKPGFLISPHCSMLIKGFEGGYNYTRMVTSGVERYDDKPCKNRYSHPHDALQYLMMGAGEGLEVIRGKHTSSVTRAKRGNSLWDQLKKKRSGSKQSRMRL
jgi:hypothetical protein